MGNIMKTVTRGRRTFDYNNTHIWEKITEFYQSDSANKRSEGAINITAASMRLPDLTWRWVSWGHNGSSNGFSRHRFISNCFLSPPSLPIQARYFSSCSPTLITDRNLFCSEPASPNIGTQYPPHNHHRHHQTITLPPA